VQQHNEMIISRWYIGR